MEKLKVWWHNVDLREERIYLEGEKNGEKEENNNGEEKKRHLKKNPVEKSYQWKLSTWKSSKKE